MQNYQNRQFGGFNISLSPVVKWIIGINIGVFLFQNASPNSLSLIFGLVPYSIIHNLTIWQFVTYMFMHGDFWHLFWNMLILLMLGPRLEYYWGKNEFIKYYMITGIGAGLVNVLFLWNSGIPTIGASGAIYGILAAYALLFPEQTFYIYFLFPVKARTLVIFLGGMTLFLAFGSSGGGIAHFAHLGGLVIGYLYLRYNFRKKLKPVNVLKFYQNYKQEKKFKHEEKQKVQEEDLRQAVDRILDKINKGGIDSLTDREKELLKKAGQHFSKGRPN